MNLLCFEDSRQSSELPVTCVEALLSPRLAPECITWQNKPDKGRTGRSDKAMCLSVSGSQMASAGSAHDYSYFSLLTVNAIIGRPRTV